jgi:hypothetical protein
MTALAVTTSIVAVIAVCRRTPSKKAGDEESPSQYGALPARLVALPTIQYEAWSEPHDPAVTQYMEAPSVRGAEYSAVTLSPARASYLQFWRRQRQ